MPLHDYSALPYVKDKLLSCATRTLQTISKNPLVEESVTFNRVNHAWEHFPTPRIGHGMLTDEDLFNGADWCKIAV